MGFTHGWTHSQTTPLPTDCLHPVQATSFSYLRLYTGFLLLLLLQSVLLRAARTLLLKQKQGQAIPSKTLEWRGLPLALLHLPPPSRPPSRPLTLASPVPLTPQAVPALGHLYLWWPLPTRPHSSTFPRALSPHSLQVSVQMSPQAFPGHPLPLLLTTPLPSLVFLNTYHRFIYIFTFKISPVRIVLPPVYPQHLEQLPDR